MSQAGEDGRGSRTGARRRTRRSWRPGSAETDRRSRGNDGRVPRRSRAARGRRRGGLVGDDRGQTLQDYATGISVFLIVTAFVFAFLPSIFAPFQSPIQSDQTAQAQRVSTLVTTDLSTAAAETTINASETTRFFSASDAPADGDDLRARYGLDETVQVNVTLQTVESMPDLTVGDRVEDHAVATSARIVMDNANRCRPTCRVVVRVW